MMNTVRQHLVLQCLGCHSTLPYTIVVHSDKVDLSGAEVRYLPYLLGKEENVPAICPDCGQLGLGLEMWGIKTGAGIPEKEVGEGRDIPFELGEQIR